MTGQEHLFENHQSLEKPATRIKLMCWRETSDGEMCASLLGNTEEKPCNACVKGNEYTSNRYTGYPDCGFLGGRKWIACRVSSREWELEEWRRPGRKGFLDVSRIWHMLAKVEG